MVNSRNLTGGAQHGASRKTRHLYLAETRHYQIAATPVLLIISFMQSWLWRGNRQEYDQNRGHDSGKQGGS
ncbi:hypothetical protein PQR25_19335 [Paraburkholderia nemoris]|uniref:hypothetical protein n=1 Tax=Paraburkholderia nemoris TaxID=2793076 RepID=UPI0038BB2086